METGQDVAPIAVTQWSLMDASCCLPISASSTIPFDTDDTASPTFEHHFGPIFPCRHYFILFYFTVFPSIVLECKKKERFKYSRRVIHLYDRLKIRMM